MQSSVLFDARKRHLIEIGLITASEADLGLTRCAFAALECVVS